MNEQIEKQIYCPPSVLKAENEKPVISFKCLSPEYMRTVLQIAKLFEYMKEFDTMPSK